MGQSIPKDTLTRAYRLGVERILQAADKSQSTKFKEIARELGCDEDEKAFDDKLRKIAKAKPEKPKKED